MKVGKIGVKTIVIGVAALLVAAQIVYSASRLLSANGTAGGGVSPTSAWPRGRADDIVGIELSRPGGAPLATLERRNGEWLIRNLDEAPADAAKIQAFLDAMLGGVPRSPAAGETADGAAAGLAADSGVEVVLTRADESRLPGVVIGLMPEGSFDGTYVRAAAGEDVAVFPGDLRGGMGMWRNQPDQEPSLRFWLQTRVLSFDPSAVAAFTIDYPDHRLEFAREKDGAWRLLTPAPGGAWSPEALSAWLLELSDFHIADIPEPGEESIPFREAVSHTIHLVLADGSEKYVVVSPNRYGEGMRAATSDHPGRVYHLPEWRFRMYFQRMNALFPEAAPAFDMDDIRFVDIRRGGESVKFSRRQGEWRAVAMPYAPKARRLDKLARLLASWRPEDYADGGIRLARPLYGSPLIEVTLANGDVHQYRLGGRHQVFPWRYVMVDGAAVLSIGDAAAEAMFPGFSEVLELGRVFDGFEPDKLESVELLNAETGTLFVSFRRVHGPREFWEAQNADGELELTPLEIAELAYAPLFWKVAGFPDRAGPVALQPGPFRLRVAGGGSERSITVLVPTGKEMPYLTEGDRLLLLSVNDFFSWVGAAQEVNKRISAKAAEAAPAPRESFQAEGGETR